MIDSMFSVNLKQIGRHLSRPRSQRGELSDTMPKRGKLARGRFWARWRVYARRPDGTEVVRRAEKIIDRQAAESLGLRLEYSGPLNRTDAWKALGKLIEQTNGNGRNPVVDGSRVTLAELAREYLDLSKPNWEAWTAENAENLVVTHLINGPLGSRPIPQVTDAELQRFLNVYVEKDSSSSLLGKLIRYIRAVFNVAVERRLIDRSPATRLKARSRKKPSERTHTLQECSAILAQVAGRDHLIISIFVQLGLRSEEEFVLRRNDVLHGALVIDEAIVHGRIKATKTEASADVMYLPPDLELELKHYLEMLEDKSPDAWLFPASRKGVPLRPANFLKRVLKKAAKRANVEGVNFQSLRRTSATLFGAKAKDPKSTQAHMRHSDPRITLKHYQKEIPAEIRSAARALEVDLIAEKKKLEAEQKGIVH